jgi:hypothetical protein
MGTENQEADAGVFQEFSTRLRERRRRAERVGDSASVARYDAMQAVLRTKLVPLLCPDALTLAGEAARAAFEGAEEGTWLQRMCRERDRSGGNLVALYKAVRLLRTVGIWPWRPAELAEPDAREGEHVGVAEPAAGPGGDHGESALTLGS